MAIRAYRLINRASSGHQKLSKSARRVLNRACADAERTGNVITTNPLGLGGQAQLVLWSQDTKVVCRERGPRLDDELPHEEVVLMLRFLREANGTTETEMLKRQVFDLLGWKRRTPKIDEFLDECMELLETG